MPGKHPQPERLRDVERYLSLQLRHAEIEAKIVEKYGCSDRTVRNDIRKVYARLEAEGEKERPMRKSQMRETLRKFYQRAVSKDQWAPALQALDRLCRLDGLYEADKISAELKQTIEHRVRHMTTDQRRSRLDQLFNRWEEHTIGEVSEADVGRLEN